MAVRVEWDEKKNRTNVAKHGIDFAAVVPIFEDPLSLTISDRMVDGERRYRIISARHATSPERKAYEEGEYESAKSPNNRRTTRR